MENIIIEKTDALNKDINELITLFGKIPKENESKAKIDKACDHLIIGISMLQELINIKFNNSNEQYQEK